MLHSAKVLLGKKNCNILAECKGVSSEGGRLVRLLLRAEGPYSQHSISPGGTFGPAGLSHRGSGELLHSAKMLRKIILPFLFLFLQGGLVFQRVAGSPGIGILQVLPFRVSPGEGKGNPLQEGVLLLQRLNDLALSEAKTLPEDDWRLNGGNGFGSPL